MYSKKLTKNNNIFIDRNLKFSKKQKSTFKTFNKLWKESKIYRKSDHSDKKVQLNEFKSLLNLSVFFA